MKCIIRIGFPEKLQNIRLSIFIIFVYLSVKFFLRKYVGKKIIRKIIAGKGKHSVHGPVLKEGVLEFIGENYGSILKCEEDAKNAGLLNITYYSN